MRKFVDVRDIGYERMRFGVLSDIHITTSKQQPYFEKVLRQLDAWKVDGVLACGDLADYGLEQQLQLLADSWFKIFPNGKGSDGRSVQYQYRDVSARGRIRALGSNRKPRRGSCF